MYVEQTWLISYGMQVEPYPDPMTELFHKELFLLSYQSHRDLFEYSRHYRGSPSIGSSGHEASNHYSDQPIHTYYDDIEPETFNVWNHLFDSFHSVMLPPLNIPTATFIRSRKLFPHLSLSISFFALGAHSSQRLFSNSTRALCWDVNF